jgi:hypothetical protein
VGGAVKFYVKLQILFNHFTPNSAHQIHFLSIMLGAPSVVTPFSFIQWN